MGGASRSTRFSPRDGEDGEEPENGLKSLVRPENMHFFPGAPQANFSRKWRNIRNNLEMEIPDLVRHSPNKRTWDPFLRGLLMHGGREGRPGRPGSSRFAPRRRKSRGAQIRPRNSVRP